MFSTYLELGFDHILDFKGYDHILFVIVLCAVYKVSEWKKILILVTAFTIGHSITLAMSALNVVSFNAKIIEFLIPLTILITALYNVVETKKNHLNVNANYLMALFFGFIHGLGFSNYFKALLGQEESVVMPLLAFNLGVELGQLIIVALTMIAAYIFMNILKVKQREWILFVSGAAAGVAYILLMEAKIW
ncbi:MAG: HupE/UreJ family protein [Saprospiraceae bacterium]|nr:HupE/UreJ family protein [Saprospiraceae bacterium]